MILVLLLVIFCSFSITVAASRCTWAFARDKAIPGSRLWSHIDEKRGAPVWAIVLLTIVQALLGLINLGSSSAFTAFVSVGVMALEVSYVIPVATSLFHGRRDVNSARFTCGPIIGTTVNLYCGGLDILSGRSF
jgi:amino acid transporter